MLLTNVDPSSSQDSPEANQIETFGHVAFVTIIAEVAAMDVVLFVATTTGGRQADLASHRGPVAGDAVETLVCAIQHIVCFLIVIECPQFPTIRVVTETAARSKPFAMRVVTFVTIDAGQRCIFIGGSGVTFFARNYGMQADKGESRQVVVKEYFCPPRLLVMAAVACLTLLPFVDIVIPMAAVAISL